MKKISGSIDLLTMNGISYLPYLEHYGWGFLQSNDRPLRWIDLEWQSKIQRKSLALQILSF